MSKVLIVLDPGHFHGVNNGVVEGYCEGDKMFTLSQYQKKALETIGFKVVITHKVNRDLSLYERGKIAADKSDKFDKVVFISNHTSDSENGVGVYRSVKRDESVVLGNLLLDNIISIMGTKRRGVFVSKGHYGDIYGVLRGATIKQDNKVDAFIIQYGNHNDITECEYLNNDDNLKAIADAVANTLNQYFNKE